MDFAIQGLIDRAYVRIQALYDFYELTSSDWDRFRLESPKLLETIEKIEDVNILSYEEMKVVCHKWIENYHLLFKRRAYLRGRT